MKLICFNLERFGELHCCTSPYIYPLNAEHTAHYSVSWGVKLIWFAICFPRSNLYGGAVDASPSVCHFSQPTHSHVILHPFSYFHYLVSSHIKDNSSLSTLELQPKSHLKMAPPPAKKVKIDLDLQKDIKVDPESNKPIIFTTPGTQPDCRLRVFNQDFLVYSGLLKINSAFFRKFLDPSSGKSPASSEVYKYEWFTCVDDSDSNCWSLTNDPKVIKIP